MKKSDKNNKNNKLINIGVGKKAKLVIVDEVNVRFEGLDPVVRRACYDKLKYFIHAARHTAAFKMGKWDGCVSLFAVNGNTYLNVIDKVLPIIAEDAGYELEIEDCRPRYEFEFQDVYPEYIFDNAPNPVWPKGHPAEGEPIILRDYQVEIIRNYLENPQCIQEVATGAGKTLMTATLSHLCEPFGRTLVIVPNKSLVEQTEADYKNIGLDVGVYYGDRKEPGHKHTICTWQSLDRLNKNSTKKKKSGPELTQLDIDTFTKDIVAVIVDETHMAKADVLKGLLCGPFAEVPIRWGLTGTVPKEEHEYMTIVSGIGKVVHRLSAKELMDKGVLANCHVDILQLKDQVEFTNYMDEYSYLVSDYNRLDWISEFVKEIAKTGNTLVLFTRVETGKELHRRIEGSELIYGAVQSSDRKKVYDEVSGSDGHIILASYGVAAVGINIPRIFNLVLFEPGKSFVRVVQSIGRGIRKAKDKDFVQIYDITSTCKFSARHLTTRKKIYKDAQYPFTVKKIDYLKDF